MSTATHTRLLHRRHGHATFEGRSSKLYDLMARRFLRGLYRPIAEDVSLSAPDGAAVLDVGTGPGVLLTEIARLRPDLRVAGIDPSADIVVAAERNVAESGARVSAHVGDAADLPFGDDTFGLVITSFSLHHGDDVDAAVPELARVLRPGGHCYVYDFQRAPFEALDAAANRRQVLNAQRRHTVIHTGQSFFRRCVRHDMSAQPGEHMNTRGTHHR